MRKWKIQAEIERVFGCVCVREREVLTTLEDI